MPHTYTWTCDQCGKKSGKSPGSPMGWAAVSIRLNRGVLGRTKHLCEMHTAILLKKIHGRKSGEGACPECKGKKWVSDYHDHERITCPACHGTGTAGEGEK